MGKKKRMVNVLFLIFLIHLKIGCFIFYRLKWSIIYMYYIYSY